MRPQFRGMNEVLRATNSLPEMKSMPKAQFQAWLADNIEIYWAFQKFAYQAIQQRRERFSAYMIRERVRWYTNIEYGGEFKISNNVTPYMARLLILDMPILEQIFSSKKLEREDWIKFEQGITEQRELL